MPDPNTKTIELDPSQKRALVKIAELGKRKPTDTGVSHFAELI